MRTAQCCHRRRSQKARAWPHALHFHAVDEKRPINRLSGCRDSPDAATVSRTLAPQSPARARGQEVTSQQESRSIRAVIVTAIAIFALTAASALAQTVPVVTGDA